MAKSAETLKEDSLFVDFFKKTFFTSIGALFMTEETIRSHLREMRLPQEVMKGMVNNAKKGKEEVMELVRSEIRKMLQTLDVAKEVKEFLRNHHVHINIHFTRKENSQ